MIHRALADWASGLRNFVAFSLPLSSGLVSVNKLIASTKKEMIPQDSHILTMDYHLITLNCEYEINSFTYMEL